MISFFILISLFIVGCNEVVSECPSGAEPVGKKPPEGTSRYCGISKYGVFKKHGNYTTWYADGKVKEKGQYTDGKKDGKWICFGKDGIAVNQEWDNGALKKGDPCP